MTRARVKNGVAVQPYPYTLRDFYAEYPNTSPLKGDRWPGDVAEVFGVMQVTPTTPPTPTATQSLVEELPVFVNGVLTQQWSLRNWTAQEIADAQAAAAEQARRSAIGTSVSSDGPLAQLRAATPTQIDAYIDANVTNLAEARAFLKRLTKLTVYILGRVE